MMLIRFILTFSFLLLLQTGFCQRIQGGFSLYLDYNLYHWYRNPDYISPEGNSSGQILNVLPLGGVGMWVGYPGSFTICIEGGVDYMPYSFNLGNFEGLGAVSLPVLIRATQPFDPQSDNSPYISIGAGWQWNRTELYARPKQPSRIINPYFRTTVIEMCLGMGSGWKKENRQIGMLAFFARLGIAPNDAMSLNFGLRARLMVNPEGKNHNVPGKELREKSYQARLNPTNAYF